jgi:hypothetical protein
MDLLLEWIASASGAVAAKFKSNAASEKTRPKQCLF